MADATPLTENEQLLLLAAAECGLGPDHGLSVANSAKVIRLAARWKGVPDSDLRCMEGPDWHPVVEELFESLVRMVQCRRTEVAAPLPDRTGEPLFEGGGNWGDPDDPAQPPSWPLYTSCRLTRRGDELARELSARRGMSGAGA